MAGSSITSELKGLNLEEFCRMPSTAPVSAPHSVVGRSLGAIPKAARQPPPPKASPPPPPKPQQQPEIPRAMTAEVAGAEETEDGVEAQEAAASPGLGKRRKNRKQRRRRIVPEAKAEHQAGKTLDAMPDPRDDRRVPDFNFPELDRLCKAATPQTALLLSGEAVQEEEEEEKRLPAAEASSAPAAPSGPRPVNAKKAGARRKRGGAKRKKQKSPEPAKGAENKENSIKFEAAKSSDEESGDDSNSSPKFNWQNVTKNGMIKKCILVDGVTEGGRPRSGDTVLVKSQGCNSIDILEFG